MGPRAHKPGRGADIRGWLVAFLFVVSSVAFAQVPSAKVLGTIKSASGNTLVLTADTGTDTTVTVADAARIVRTLPGQTDLKTATAITAADIQVGDRVLARGQAADSGALLASSIIVMSKSDIAQKQQQERDEWRKGVGGLVKSVDGGAGTVTLANSLLASGKPIVVHVAPDTSIRRYAPDSVKFEDAKPGTLDQIKAGDQLRARGTKSSDGTEFAAQAIVSGSFRDIAGTVISTDAASNSVSVMDLATKKPVMVKVSSETQLRKLPPMVAQMIALRLKGGAPGEQPGPSPPQAPSGSGAAAGGSGNGSGRGNSPGQGGTAASGGTERIGRGPGAGGVPGNWRNGGGPPDFQQMLSRMPTVKVTDLNKGDAVMLVATGGSSASGPTAITMLAGVEPILSSGPPGMNAGTLLSPWNLGAAAGAGGDPSTQ
jgi:hypothetical protein